MTQERNGQRFFDGRCRRLVDKCRVEGIFLFPEKKDTSHNDSIHRFEDDKDERHSDNPHASMVLKFELGAVLLFMLFQTGSFHFHVLDGKMPDDIWHFCLTAIYLGFTTSHLSTANVRMKYWWSRSVVRRDWGTHSQREPVSPGRYALVDRMLGTGRSRAYGRGTDRQSNVRLIDNTY